MTYYSIYVRFRGRDLSATVHKYDTFSFVYFFDSAIVLEFGGQHEFDSQNKYVKKEKELPKDAADLFRAITQQLQ